MRIGALEAGGTKMVCAIGDENGNIRDRDMEERSCFGRWSICRRTEF